MKLATTLAAALAATTIAGSAWPAPEQIRIGYMSTLSGPAGSYGEEMLNAYRLGLEQTGGTLGGIPVELIIGDDQARPQIAVQLARQMMQRDEVHFFSGLIFSHVVEAVNSVVLPADRIVVATVGGNAEVAGEACEENFFISSWSTDTVFEAIGAHLAEQGVERVSAIVTNYQAGWDAAEGLKRGYGGDLAAEVLVRLDQSDFGAELSQIRSAAPQALVMFLPGGSGIAFMRQFAGAGLNETIEPYAATFQADETTFAALGETAVGLINAGAWNPYIDNEANQRFVAAFRDEYGRNPSILAAMSYDTVLLLDAAVAAVDGEVDDVDRFREALRNVRFDSVRGDFAFNNNHFPVQDFYISRVETGPDGGLHNALVTKVFEDRSDAHHASCPLQ